MLTANRVIICLATTLLINFDVKNRLDTGWCSCRQRPGLVSLEVVWQWRVSVSRAADFAEETHWPSEWGTKWTPVIGKWVVRVGLDRKRHYIMTYFLMWVPWVPWKWITAGQRRTSAYGLGCIWHYMKYFITLHYKESSKSVCSMIHHTSDVTITSQQRRHRLPNPRRISAVILSWMNQ